MTGESEWTVILENTRKAMWVWLVDITYNSAGSSLATGLMLRLVGIRGTAGMCKRQVRRILLFMTSIECSCVQTTMPQYQFVVHEKPLLNWSGFIFSFQMKTQWVAFMWAFRFHHKHKVSPAYFSYIHIFLLIQLFKAASSRMQCLSPKHLI